MNLTITTDDVQTVDCDTMIAGVVRRSTPQGERELVLSPIAERIDTLLDGLLSQRHNDGEFQGNQGELLTLYPMGRLTARRVIIVGLGKQEALNTRAIQRASASAVRHAQNTGAKRIALPLLWQGPEIEGALVIQAQTEGALHGSYTFRKYQTSDEKKQAISQLQLLVDSTEQASFEQAVQKGRVLAEATNLARDLVNEPGNVLTPEELANRARTMAEQYGLKCEIFERAKIAEMGMGGLLGVSSGSAKQPYFIILRYRGDQSNNKGLALVGKGITFDTGGISIKPALGMEDMKGDMGGGAAVIGAMQALAVLKPRINVTGLIPTCENMVDGDSYRPGDILRMLNGKTVEIVNTDAEGRLILADALSYAVREGLSPIIDLATLTGGIVVALGHVMSGLFSNDEQLTQEIIAAGHRAGEKYWPMPLDDEYTHLVKSDIADILQSAGRWASSITAAKVLEHFVGDTPWAHLDIAGTSDIEKPRSYQEKGGTGVGVRTLVELILHWSI